MEVPSPRDAFWQLLFAEGVPWAPESSRAAARGPSYGPKADDDDDDANDDHDEDDDHDDGGGDNDEHDDDKDDDGSGG